MAHLINVERICLTKYKKRFIHFLGRLFGLRLLTDILAGKVDCTFAPMMLYSSEIWGLENCELFENCF